jgi:predicted RNA-binding Zn-ribbon protein involved in translation (DUF1610 family)
MSYLDFLIQDCLREYANDYIPSSIDESTAQSTQSAKLIDVPLLLERNRFSFKYTNLVSRASPAITNSLPVPSTQYDNFAEAPFVFPAKETLSGLKSMESLPHVSPVKTNAKFNCPHCRKAFLGAKQLLRHQKKHDTPNKYSCPIVGCKTKMYRADAIRTHVKSHERRIFMDEQALL